MGMKHRVKNAAAIKPSDITSERNPSHGDKQRFCEGRDNVSKFR
jgi:hypothetical protein